MTKKMTRLEAIEYLEKKNILSNPFEQKERKFTKEEEKQIRKTMTEGVTPTKRGKLYGDPLCLLDE